MDVYLKSALAALLALGWAATAAAQEQWTEYSYPAAGFAVQFPRSPDVTQATFKTAAGAALPSTRYEVREQSIVYSVEIVDYSGASVDATSTIAETEKSFGAAGKVTVAIDARVNREYGRELSVTGADGSHSAVALFFVAHHLFIVSGKALPPEALSRSGDTIRFQESLRFLEANGDFPDFGASRGVERSGGPHAAA